MMKLKVTMAVLLLIAVPQAQAKWGWKKTLGVLAVAAGAVIAVNGIKTTNKAYR